MKVVSLIAKTQNRLYMRIILSFRRKIKWRLIYLHQYRMIVTINWGTAVFQVLSFLPLPPPFVIHTSITVINLYKPSIRSQWHPLFLAIWHPASTKHKFWKKFIHVSTQRVTPHMKFIWNFPASYSTYIVIITVNWISWFRKVKRPKKST